ncbi:hypothetical protein BU25DRAFT_108284 [Macroventuria anomochaeta]|uniref:Uncharacterized protein n=1 Tax=Macroventuria anomochaeta TaxID=301207 RepID=A0ACB6RUU2_9PLEO|nr:uncharacterized protein BU25DRAFT_108284 [Macroventuria anomochaeta]KAF2625651.1 hypothetical protein BU25DRAFT_108284 [Macroventuria anomochaeta]
MADRGCRLGTTLTLSTCSPTRSGSDRRRANQAVSLQSARRLHYSPRTTGSAAVLSPRPSNNQRPQADNSSNGSDGSSGALWQQLSRHLPRSRHGAMLVTSRIRRAVMQAVKDNDIVPDEPSDDCLFA